MPVRIYKLVDPRSPDAVRYVGKTSRELHDRLYRHLREAALGLKAHRFHWIRSLAKDGVTPSIIEIETVSDTDWPEREKYWIARLSADGHNLTNNAPGGLGVGAEWWQKFWSDPWRREKQSAALKAYNADPAVRDRKRRQMTARYAGIKKPPRVKLTDEQRVLRLQESWNGNDARRANQSRHATQRWSDPDYRARVKENIGAAIRARSKHERSAATLKGWETRRNNRNKEIISVA